VTLTDVADQQDEWIRIAKYLGADQELAQDIVQDMYLRVAEIEQREGSLERLENYYGKINTVYIFKIIQNLYYDHCKKSQHKEQVVEIEINEIDHNNVEALFSTTLLSIQAVISKMNEYDQMMCEMYFVKGISLRKIHKETGIGVHSIFNTIKNAKEKIRRNAETHYNNYKEEKDKQETIRWIRRYD